MSGVLCLLQKEQRKGPDGNARASSRPPTFSTPYSDFSWTHGQWREAESSGDEITDKEPPTLDGYNIAMAQIAGLSDIKIPESLTFILKKEWASATAKKKKNRCARKRVTTPAGPCVQ